MIACLNGNQTMGRITHGHNWIKIDKLRNYDKPFIFDCQAVNLAPPKELNTHGMSTIL